MPSLSLGNRIWGSMMDLLWSQWGALGVPVGARSSAALVDPEALLIETAVLTSERPDARVRDGAIAWSVVHHDLIATARLKRLLGRRDEHATSAFLELSRQVADTAGRLSWPMADEAARWHSTVQVRLPKLDEQQGLLRLRARGLFGANARAEAVAYLACVDGAVELAVLERDTHYSRQQITDALNGLVLANWVARSTLGKSLRFELTALARLQLRVPMRDLPIGPRAGDVIAVADAPVWIDWDHRYRLIRSIASAALELERGHLIQSLSGLRRLDDEFAALSIPTPAVIAPDEDDAIVAARITEWLDRAEIRLTGRGLLP